MEEYLRGKTQKAIEGCILITMNILAICGNIFVCWVVYRKRKNLSAPYLLVLALAVSDLMVAVTCFPLCVQAFLSDRWILSHEMCQFNGFVIYFWAGISVPTLALTAVNRYFRVVKAQIYRNYFTIKTSFTMVTAVWVFTLFDGFLSTFVGPVTYEYNPRYVFCIGTFTSKAHQKAIGFSLHLIHVLIPLVIIIFCYVNVFLTIRRHNANVMPSLHAGQGAQLAVNAWEMRVTRLLFFIVVGFVICWIPVIIIGLLAHSSSVNLPDFAYELYTFFAFMSAVINPVIYGVVNRDFRREFQRSFNVNNLPRRVKLGRGRKA